MRRVLCALAAAAAAGRAWGLDMATIEEWMKDVADSPCRLELLALGLSFVNAHGCISSVVSWNELARCNDKVFDFLETGGEILKKEKCADPLEQLIRKKIVDVDMKPIFKTLTDLYDCAQTHEDLTECQQQAVPTLLRAGSAFANELLEGLSASTEHAAVAALDAQVALATCMRDAPRLRDQLAQNDYQAFKAKAQPLVDTINEFRAAPVKRLLDDKQQWVLDRLMELVNDQSPVAVHAARGLTVDDLTDVRKCSTEWNDYRSKLATVLKADDVREMHMRVFARIPLLNPLRPWYEAFFDNVGEFVDVVVPKLACASTWGGVDELQQCVQDMTGAFTQFVAHMEASEQKDLADDVKSGWSEDVAVLSQRPVSLEPTATATSTSTSSHVPVTTISTWVPPPRPTTSSTYTPPATPVVAPPVPMPSVPVNEPPHDNAVSERHGSHWWSVIWKSMLTVTCLAALALAVLRWRRSPLLQQARGFRPLRQKDVHDEDAEAQTLLNEFSDSDDEDDDEPLRDF